MIKMIYDESKGEKAGNKRIKIEYFINQDGCWICTSHDKEYNYYIRLYRKGKYRNLHKYVYELEKGEIPEGMVVMHTCDNPKCFNPEHLTVGTHKDNTQDMLSKDRHWNKVGEERKNSKLTETEVIEIRKDKRSNRKIAADYGVTYGTIQAIKTRRTWNHI